MALELNGACRYTISNTLVPQQSILQSTRRQRRLTVLQARRRATEEAEAEEAAEEEREREEAAVAAAAAADGGTDTSAGSGGDESDEPAHEEVQYASELHRQLATLRVDPAELEGLGLAPQEAAETAEAAAVGAGGQHCCACSPAPLCGLVCVNHRISLALFLLFSSPQVLCVTKPIILHPSLPSAEKGSFGYLAQM